MSDDAKDPSEFSKEEAEEKMEKLREEVRHHDKKYYVDNDPEISDYEYDQLVERLEAFEEAFPDLVTDDSPTRKVGAKVETTFETVKHKTAMLSLDNSYDEEELRDFDKRVRKDAGSVEYVLEPKIDGLGVALVYVNGFLERGATRGDGKKGELITENVKTIKSIPLKLLDTDLAQGETEVRGEVYMPDASFEEVNERRKEEGKDLFANPRNAASGSLRQKDPRVTAERGLAIFIYTLTASEAEFKTHMETLEAMKEAGLRINEHVSLHENIDDVIDAIEEWKEKKDELGYEVDGMVVKVNSLEKQRELGSTTKHPRWAMAYKFPAKRVTAKLKDVVFQVGRTGIITPVAILDPQEISGSVVSRATLHNFDEVERKDIRIGDHVLVEKAGMVIPQVVKSIKGKRKGDEEKVEKPEECPECGEEIHYEDVYIRCVNDACPAKAKERILHFASRNAMDIDGLGPSLVEKLMEADLVEKISDIYSVDEEDLVGLPGVKEKSARNLLSEIEESRKADLSRLIFGLGIPQVGSFTAQLLADQFGSLEALGNADREQLESISNIGPEVAKRIVGFFTDEENKKELARLKEAGVNTQAEGRKGDLSGKTFLFTGGLETFTRDEAKDRVRALGGLVKNSVSEDLDYVVVGDKPGKKLDKAKEKGVEIIDEDEFLTLIGQD